MATKQKGISKMTVPECLKELAKLEKEGIEFDTKYNKETPLKELRELVKDGRAALAEEDSEDSDEKFGAGSGEDKNDSDKSEDSDASSDEEDSEEGSDDDSDEDEEGDDDKDDAPTPPVRTIGGRKFNEPTLTIVCKDGTARTYAASTHGKVWKTLAANYHEAKKGSKLVKG